MIFCYFIKWLILILRFFIQSILDVIRFVNKNLSINYTQRELIFHYLKIKICKTNYLTLTNVCINNEISKKYIIDLFEFFVQTWENFFECDYNCYKNKIRKKKFKTNCRALLLFINFLFID